jgi:hypothetical protein
MPDSKGRSTNARGGTIMTVIKDPDQWTVQDCIEDCHYHSRFCEEQEDGSLVCPPGIRSCEEDCRKRYSA